MNAPVPSVVQLAMCSDDLPRTLRMYIEVFGFADAGGRKFWGEWLAHVQDVGDDAACLLWWLVGRQDLLQLEFFHHTLPRQRPLPADWRPSDQGWVRWGMAIPDFDDALQRLRAFGVETLTEPIEHGGLRRVCFRDPCVGIVVEVMEDGEALPGGVRPRYYDLAPAVVYAALSVPDLHRARNFYVNTVGLVEEAAETLHSVELEALWGLDGARRDAVVVRGGDTYLELLGYSDPAPRPKPEGYRLSDQGFMNVAVGFRSRPPAEELLERIEAAGGSVNAGLPPSPAGGTYVEDNQRVSLEVAAQPREFDPDFGFMPVPLFGRGASWPQAGIPPAG
jgi:catechol 2,3-dioxygenase-like lactoylglutathione lyase family enzyme